MDGAPPFAARVAHRSVAKVAVKLYASLALTGRGHGTDRAVILGLCGFTAATYDADAAEAVLRDIRGGGALPLAGGQSITFDESNDIVWAGRERLTFPPNALTFTAFDSEGAVL